MQINHKAERKIDLFTDRQVDKSTDTNTEKQAYRKVKKI